jgi:Holliday junction resolvase
MLVASSNYSSYERELKAILEGDSETLQRYRKNSSSQQTLDALDELERHPFLVVRAAGSHGFDLVALRGSLTLPIEVKCSGHPVIHFTASKGRNKEQYEALLAHTSKAGLALFYAYRLVGGVRGDDPWRLFSSTNVPEKGVVRVVASKTPQVDRTSSGNQVLRWSDGKPLMEFVAWTLAIS